MDLGISYKLGNIDLKKKTNARKGWKRCGWYKQYNQVQAKCSRSHRQFLVLALSRKAVQIGRTCQTSCNHTLYIAVCCDFRHGGSTCNGFPLWSKIDKKNVQICKSQDTVNCYSHLLAGPICVQPSGLAR